MASQKAQIHRYKITSLNSQSIAKVMWRCLRCQILRKRRTSSLRSRVFVTAAYGGQIQSIKNLERVRKFGEKFCFGV